MRLRHRRQQPWSRPRLRSRRLLLKRSSRLPRLRASHPPSRPGRLPRERCGRRRMDTGTTHLSRRPRATATRRTRFRSRPRPLRSRRARALRRQWRSPSLQVPPLPAKSGRSRTDIGMTPLPERCRTRFSRFQSPFRSRPALSPQARSGRRSMATGTTGSDHKDAG